jgi:hypothetical protein
MSLDRVLDPLADRLSGELEGTRVSDVAPTASVDLPCVVLSLSDVRQVLAGIGRVPRGTRTGSLAVTATVDLANPVLDLGNGEELDLLSTDRETLTLPHGPVVRADGTTDLPFAAGDVSANDGAAFTLVPASPTGHQFTVDPVQGILQFGSTLAVVGSLHVGYHIGQWDSIVTRAQGTLAMDISATGADQVRALARSIATSAALDSHGLRVEPSSWPPVAPATLADGTDVRTQRLLFHLDAEVEDSVLTSSGGVIVQVDVTGSLTAPVPDAEPEALEPMTVTQGAPK